MSKTATAEQQPHAVVELIPLDKIAESPTNHRQRSWGDMAELARSVKEKGVLSPILVRPMKGIGSNLYELVFGHRRLRAAKEAGLDAIPAMVRDLTDLEVVEAQIIENVQRVDVHPMEEAEGFAQLLESKERKYSVEEIAAKTGKSKAYVYGRLVLLKLCKEARKAFYDGKLSASTALEVAKIPNHDRQREALKEIEPDPWDKTPRTLEEVRDIIRDGYMLRLAEAPFSRDDATLGAGPCATCAKRSGAQPELFADVAKQDGDLCLDRTCFGEKRKAWGERRVAEAEASGQKVITGAAAKKIAPHGDVTSSSGFVNLNEKCWEDPKNRTWKQILGKEAPVVLVQTEGGELVEAVEKKAAVDVLKEKGSKLVSEIRSETRRDPSFDRQRRQQMIRRRGVEKAIALIVERAEAKPLDEGFLVDAVLDLAWHDTATDVAKRRELEFGKGKRPEEALGALRKKLDPAQLRGLVVEALVTRGAYSTWAIGYADRLKLAAKLYGVDLEKCKAEALAEVKAKEDAKKAKEKEKQRAAAKKTKEPTKRPAGVITRWAADDQAKRPPKFVIEATGLETKKAIVAKYGPNACFEMGKPTPRIAGVTSGDSKPKKQRKVYAPAAAEIDVKTGLPEHGPEGTRCPKHGGDWRDCPTCVAEVSRVKATPGRLAWVDDDGAKDALGGRTGSAAVPGGTYLLKRHPAGWLNAFWCPENGKRLQLATNSTGEFAKERCESHYARQAPRATAAEIAAEKCLDCGVAAGEASPGCDSCDHGRAKAPAEPKAVTDLVGTREDAIAAHEERTKKPAKKGKGVARG